MRSLAFVLFVAALVVAARIADAQEVDSPTSSPEFFVVEGLAPGDELNIRATASATGMVVGRLPNGTKLKNLGCSDLNDIHWCKVADTQSTHLVGWAASRYLIEFGAGLPEAEGPEAASLEPEQDQFDATGDIPCARYFGQPMTVCAARITRGNAGEAEVAVTWPDGGERLIRFHGGKPEGSDAPEDIRVTRESDLHMIRIGKGERFEIPDALAFGG